WNLVAVDVEYGSCTIQGNTIHNNTIGIKAYQTSNLNILGNTISGWNLADKGVVITYSNGWNLNGNTITGWNLASTGVETSNSNSWNMGGNTIQGWNLGVDIDTCTGWNLGWNLNSNTINGWNLGSKGIQVSNSQGWNLGYNEVYGWNLGVELNNPGCTFEYNNLHNNTYGVNITGNTATTLNIENNIFTGWNLGSSETAITINNCNGWNLYNNVIQGWNLGIDITNCNGWNLGATGNSNTINGWNLGSNKGIEIDTCTGWNLGHNEIYGWNLAVEVSNSGCILHDNNIYNNTDGLVITGTSNFTIENNTFHNNTGEAVQIAPDDTLLFRDNVLNDNGLAINLTTVSSAAFHFENCSFSGNTYNYRILSGSPYSLNCTYDTWYTGMIDPASGASASIIIKNYLHIEVYNTTSDPISGAVVWLNDTGSVESLGATDANGLIPWIIITDRIVDKSSFTENTTQLNVSDGTKSFLNNPRFVNMSTSMTEIFNEGGDSIVPSAPASIVISYQSDAVTISWDAVTNQGDYIFYRVYRSTDPNAAWPWTVPAGWEELTATQVVDLTNTWNDTTEYYYIVRAFDIYDGLSINSTMGAKSVIVMGAGLNLVGMDLPIDLIRPDIGFGPEGCKNATLEIEAQNPGVSVLVIRKYTAGGWVKY
ncbi:MAG: right-handed parallel beta-helix repeat-containing protein, partial [Thermoplasmata archaeon]|nr:right-handed parallel beta-helix repeat-containing protein [Thermoplasmata archaeon]